MDKYTVHVGNIGTVYSGNNRRKADANFNFYVNSSKTNQYSRACGESVHLVEHGRFEDIAREFIGSIDEKEMNHNYDDAIGCAELSGDFE